MAFSKEERLAEFFLRMKDAAPAGTFEAAYELMCHHLNAVEDAYSGVPNNPHAWQTDGRLNPPQHDKSFRVEGNEHIIAFRSRAHTTYISTNGAIEIRSAANGTVVFQKPGRNGGMVWQ